MKFTIEHNGKMVEVEKTSKIVVEQIKEINTVKSVHVQYTDEDALDVVGSNIKGSGIANVKYDGSSIVIDVPQNDYAKVAVTGSYRDLKDIPDPIKLPDFNSIKEEARREAKEQAVKLVDGVYMPKKGFSKLLMDHLSGHGDTIVTYDKKKDKVKVTTYVSPVQQAASSGSGSASDAAAVVNPVSQVAHGFSVGDLVYLVGSTYTLALADDVVSAEVVGMVSAVADANNFSLTTSGAVTGLSGLSAGTVYFLSPTIDGAMTSTQPSTVGQVIKPLFVADSTTSGYFINYRGELIAEAASGSNKVTAEVDFGFQSGQENNVATVTVAAAWVTPTTAIICAPFATATDDHDPEDYALEGIKAYASNIVDGVSFDIIASADYATFGKYNIQAIGV